MKMTVSFRSPPLANLTRLLILFAPLLCTGCIPLIQTTYYEPQAPEAKFTGELCWERLRIELPLKGVKLRAAIVRWDWQKMLLELNLEIDRGVMVSHRSCRSSTFHALCAGELSHPSNAESRNTLDSKQYADGHSFLDARLLRTTMETVRAHFTRVRIKVPDLNFSTFARFLRL